MPKITKTLKPGDRIGSRVITSEIYIATANVRERAYYDWRCVECGTEGTMLHSLMLGRAKTCCNDWMHKGVDKLGKLWNNMHRRCYDPDAVNYDRYGGVGVTVSGWADLHEFKTWALAQGYRWTDGVHLDRIDNSKGYHPDNCRFVTPSENYRNRKSNVHITAHGQTKLVVEWVEELGLNAGTVYSRVSRGWTGEKALYGQNLL